MTLHIFADRGLMLAETAGFDFGATADLRYTSYSQHKVPGLSVRLHQVLHVLTRPFCLRLSAYFAYRFNEGVEVDPKQLAVGLVSVQPGDHVLWLNPSRAVASDVDALHGRCACVSLYFVDPAHRLGLTPQRLRAWSTWTRMSTYSQHESATLGMAFLVPYVPSFTATVPLVKDFDIVYIGTPTPKRLLWVLYLRLHLVLRRRRGHLRLASRSAWLVKTFPGTFSGRVSFNEYAALCARSRGVLELHERDAGGVTLRATLSQALHAVHLCNLGTMPQTLKISLLHWATLDRFIKGHPESAQVTVVGASSLEPWLRDNFL